MSLGEFLKLLEGLFQVAFGGQRATQHLHGAAQIEEEIRIAAFLLPGVEEALFCFFQIVLPGSLFSVRRGRIEQGLAQMVVAAKLQRFQLHGQTLGLQVFVQAGIPLTGI